MRLILLRHGETEWNSLDRFQGHTDVELNAEGERQARRAAVGPVGDLVEQAAELVAVASPLSRARRTAEIVLEARVGAAAVALDPALVELHGGDWEGLELSLIARRWPDEHRRWRTEPALDAGPVGGETLRAGGERALRALRGHVPAHWVTAAPGRGPHDAGTDGDGARTLFAVGHGGVIRAAVGLLLRHEGEAFSALERIGNARAAVLEGTFGPEEQGWGDWRLAGYGV
ncbi:histidine phosphatase family protein [Micrococcus endophyticus]|uniref:histidine phosphatase family protein n=1 Tax=Micrococcus endophyticus TaxID=455343 RepID=UPI0034CFA7FC